MQLLKCSKLVAVAFGVGLMFLPGLADAASKRVLLRDIGAPTLAQSMNARATSQLSGLRMTAQKEGTVKVIIGLAVPFAPEGELSRAEGDQQMREIAAAAKSLQDKLAARSTHGVASPRSFASVPFVTAEVTAVQLDYLMQQKEVLSIDADGISKPFLAQSTAVVNAPVAWAAGYNGTGRAVVVIDTGVDKAHPFLAGKVVSEACYSGGGNTNFSVCPGQALSSTAPGSGVPCNEADCTHGTHVAGIVAGAGASFSGVAKGARIIAINAASSDGTSVYFADSDLMAALQRVYDLRNTYSIAAVNMSLGGGRSTSFCDTSPLKPLIDNLKAANIATVISSGNNGYTDSVTHPGCISSAITVGATWDVAGQTVNCDAVASTVDRVACFSNSSAAVDLLAPGIWITSSVPGGGYATEAGTSMAAPHVAGAWAVLRQAFPTATVSQVQSALVGSGKAVTDYRNGIVKPRINVSGALSNMKSISIGAAAYTVTEGTPSIVIPVRRASNIGTASVAYAVTNGTAVNGSDFTASNGTLTFAAGVQTANITIPILNGTVAEVRETFTIAISSPSAGYSLVAPTQATVTIIDNDPSFRLGAATYSVTEGTASVTIPVIKTRSSESASIHFATANGTAAAGSDYTAVSGTLVFPVGAYIKNIVVPITNDASAEPSQTFTVKLSSPSAGYPLVNPMIATVTIKDNDSSIKLGASSYSLAEGAGVVHIPVTRSRTTDQITIPYATSNGTAVSGSDYTGTASGNLTFAVGVATMYINVPIRNDSVPEANETFRVSLGSAPAGYALGTPSSATVTIVNDDNPCTSAAIASAVDNGSLAWSQLTPAQWCSQTGIVSGSSGTSAARSGAIGDNASSCMVTTVSSGGTFSLIWGVDSEDGYDFLEVDVDGVNVGAISGSGWQSGDLTIGSAGQHTVRFCYVKDNSTAVGGDAGFVDRLVQTSVLSVTASRSAQPPSLSVRTSNGNVVTSRRASKTLN